MLRDLTQLLVVLIPMQKDEEQEVLELILMLKVVKQLLTGLILTQKVIIQLLIIDHNMSLVSIILKILQLLKQVKEELMLKSLEMVLLKTKL